MTVLSEAISSEGTSSEATSLSNAASFKATLFEETSCEATFSSELISYFRRRWPWRFVVFDLPDRFVASLPTVAGRVQVALPPHLILNRTMEMPFVHLSTA